MMRKAFFCLLTAIVVSGLAAYAGADVYRVGPGEKHTLVSHVTDILQAGDVVEITGDLTDNFTLKAHGIPGKPITIRGLLSVENGKQRRPCLRGVSSEKFIIDCSANNIVIEGLEFAGVPLGHEGSNGAVRHNSDNLFIRNCYFHHFGWKCIIGSPEAGSIDIQFCEFEASGSIARNGKPVDIWSWTPGAVMRVEHCYFHDSLNEAHLKTHCTRNIIRYNWFENTFQQSIKVTDRIGDYSPKRPEGVYPMHTDIVGNVFVQGYSPGGRSAVLSIGGAAADEPGTEGDFNIAHNLFIMDRYVRGVGETTYMVVNGNVDRVRMYNNVFLERGGPGGTLLLCDLRWDSPETQEFVRRRGSPDPVIEGSGNWVFERSTEIPLSFLRTLRGLNPKFVDFLNGDYRPRLDSPLAKAGSWPLPQGQIADLVPEYEPQRGIPADLKPKPRRKVVPPSIGPFEVEE